MRTYYLLIATALGLGLVVHTNGTESSEPLRLSKAWDPRLTAFILSRVVVVLVVVVGVADLFGGKLHKRDTNRRKL